MTVDSVITVADIAMPSGVSAVTAEDQPVVTVTILRNAAAAEASEGGDAEAAGGDEGGDADSGDAASDAD
jgi:hypothetical protein